MKLGCCSWSFSSPNYEPPYDKAIEVIGGMGFKGVELILFEEKDLVEYYTPSKIKELRNSYRSYGIELSEFAVFTKVLERLSSMDPLEREQAFDVFKKATLVAKELGSQAMNLVSNWPYGMKAPNNYPPAYIYPFGNGVNRFSPKLYMEIPDIDYAKLWDTYMETMKECLRFVV